MEPFGTDPGVYTGIFLEPVRNGSNTGPQNSRASFGWFWTRSGRNFFSRPLQGGGRLRSSLSYATFYAFKFTKGQNLKLSIMQGVKVKTLKKPSSIV